MLTLQPAKVVRQVSMLTLQLLCSCQTVCMFFLRTGNIAPSSCHCFMQLSQRSFV